MDIESLNKLVETWFHSQEPLPSGVTVTITLAQTQLTVGVLQSSDWEHKPLTEFAEKMFPSRVSNALHHSSEWWNYHSYAVWFGDLPFSKMTVGQFVERCSEQDLLRIPNMGKTSLGQVAEALASIGYTLKRR